MARTKKEAIAQLRHEQLSERSELMALALPFLLAVGGSSDEPLCEGG